MGKCPNCLIFLYKLVCCRHQNGDGYSYNQENSLNVGDQSSADEESRTFVFDTSHQTDIEKLKYFYLQNKAPIEFNLSKYTINTEPDGYRVISKRHCNVGGREKSLGLKLHIAVHHEHNNIGMAWDAVMPLLVEYGLRDFKVILNPHDNYQIGKEIVIYEMSSRVDLPWEELLNKIETALTEQKVRFQEPPKHRCKGELTTQPEPKVNNSQYLYYTNDKLEKKDLCNDDWKNVYNNPFNVITIKKLRLTNQISSSSNYIT